MARTEITPYSIVRGHDTTAATHLVFTKVKATGMYIKTSNINSANMIFLVKRTTKSTGVGGLSIVSGSTNGAEDYQPGAYSTARDLNLTVATSSNSTAASINIIGPIETAKYKDSNGYIKINFKYGSSRLSTRLGATVASYIAAVELP